MGWDGMGWDGIGFLCQHYLICIYFFYFFSWLINTYMYISYVVSVNLANKQALPK